MISFGAISTAAGLSLLQTCVLSVVMFTGASQLALVDVVGSGGSLWASRGGGAAPAPPPGATGTTWWRNVI